MRDKKAATRDAFGLVSAYHHHFRESFGVETRPTHFHQGKEEAAFHLDYCFLPGEWAKSIKNVAVGVYNDWNSISDHVPLIVDLGIEAHPHTAPRARG